MNNRISRRTFLKGAAASMSVMGLAACQGTKSLVQPIGASERINVAGIGVGGKGDSDLNAFGERGQNIVALCDVDFNHAKNNPQRYPKAAQFADYRKMLDKLGKDIDMVTVSTPDHMHYPAAKMAMEMGKHVYCQKPLTHTIWEAREMSNLAKKYGVKTQMGNQGHGSETTRLIREWFEAGKIGECREVVLWTNRPIWPQGVDTPKEAQPVPESLDWNQWLGVAPWRAYNRAFSHFNWRGWWDYGTGALGDMACHIMDASYWSLQLGAPTRVWAESTWFSEDSAPKSSIVYYEFPARGDLPPVTLTWYDGDNMPPHPKHLEAERTIEKGSSGQVLVGSKASIKAGTYSEGARIIPEEVHRASKVTEVPKKYERAPNNDHYLEFIQAIKGEIDQAGSNFIDHAGPFSETVLLGNVAIKMRGAKLDWDSKNLRFTNNEAANALITKEYRDF